MRPQLHNKLFFSVPALLPLAASLHSLVLLLRTGFILKVYSTVLHSKCSTVRTPAFSFAINFWRTFLRHISALRSPCSLHSLVWFPFHTAIPSSHHHPYTDCQYAITDFHFFIYSGHRWISSCLATDVTSCDSKTGPSERVILSVTSVLYYSKSKDFPLLKNVFKKPFLLGYTQ
jgi:hypothetical protein